MMLPTHAVIGVAIATPMMYFAPELGTIAVVAILLGSIVPDFDMYAGHRRTLHYPTISVLLAAPATLIAVAFPHPLSIASTFFIIGFAVHCQIDRLGGGLELRPWEGTSDRGVYDHVRGRWHRPKRLISYDGSPGDLLILLGLALPLLVFHDGVIQLIVGASILIGLAYTGLRRKLAQLAPVVFGHVPDQLSGVVPDRYRC